MTETITQACDTNDGALRSILDHHAALAGELNRRVHTLLDAVRGADDTDAAKRDLAAFLDREVMPHAAAEERTLYPAAWRDPHVELLVTAMIDEHLALAGRLRALREASDPIALAATAAQIEVLFTVHLRKENDLLLPALMDARADLPSLLRDTHHLLAAHDSGASAADPELDVRTEPPARRHALILDTYGALAPGQGFVLVNDHDPKPLYYQFAAEHPGKFTWDHLESGPETWKVRIGRTPTR